MKNYISNLLLPSADLTAVARQIRAFDPHSPDSLASYSFLAYDLYIYGNHELAKHIVDLLDGVEFDGNHDKWTFARHGMTLKAWIASEGGHSDIADTIKNKILAALEKGKNDLVIQTNKNVFKRKISGDTLDYAAVDTAVANNDADAEYNARQRLLMDFLLIYSVGGSEKVPVAIAKKMIVENINRLKAI